MIEMSKKKTEKKDVKEQPVTEPETREATPEETIALLQQQLRAVVDKANELHALCRHYETTINVLTGRLKEMGGNA
jgi:cell division protein FtsI/penicillin-binding protein 2